MAPISYLTVLILCLQLPFKSYIVIVIYYIIIYGSIVLFIVPLYYLLAQKSKKIWFKSKNTIQIKKSDFLFLKIMIFSTLLHNLHFTLNKPAFQELHQIMSGFHKQKSLHCYSTLLTGQMPFISPKHGTPFLSPSKTVHLCIVSSPT